MLGEYLKAKLQTIEFQPPVTVPSNSDPKMLFVNGYWNGDIDLVGAPEGGPNYWIDDSTHTFVQRAAIYFGLTSYEAKYADGRAGVISKASDIQEEGELWAIANYNYLISNSTTATLDFYIVSHSMGGPYATGIASYLKLKGHNVRQIVYLSPYQLGGLSPFPTDWAPDIIDADTSIETYELTYASWKTQWYNSNHWLMVDPVVGDHMINNVGKYGIGLTTLGLSYLHGTTKVADVFNFIDDLKVVTAVSQTSVTTSKTWHSQSVINGGRKFYSLNNIKIDSNDPDWNTTTESY